MHTAVTMPTHKRKRGEIRSRVGGDALILYDRAIAMARPLVEDGGGLPNLAVCRDQCARRRLGALGRDGLGGSSQRVPSAK